MPGRQCLVWRRVSRSLLRPPDDVAGLHRQAVVRRRNPLEKALGEHTVRMEQAAGPDGGAEPNRQRRDVRSLHRLGVPETSPCKTHTTGLTTAIPGINHVSARRVSKHC